MKRRCYDPNQRGYHNYGGRGITVCDRWLESLFNFIEDMGEPPPGRTLDRVDNDGPYCKSNCVWSDIKTQNNNNRRNRRLTYNGQTKTVSQWSDITGLSQYVISARINKLGWSHEKALTTPKLKIGLPKTNITITYKDETKSCEEGSEQIGISYESLKYRFLRGWSVEDALTIPARKWRKGKVTRLKKAIKVDPIIGLHLIG